MTIVVTRPVLVSQEDAKPTKLFNGSHLITNVQEPVASEQEEPDEAIPLITEVDGKLVIGEEAVRVISKLQGKICVLSITGPYRTGKSYLLNHLLNKNGVFSTGHTVNACTKGIWMMPQLIKQKSAAGEEMHVLVLDSEGLGAVEQTQSHDARVFSLTLLLSSFFLYNSVGAIDENALSNLSLVVNLTKHIHVRSRPRGEEDDGTEFSNHFPSLLWVVRDFSLQLMDKGKAVTSKEYLEIALRPQPGFNDKSMSKNRIRAMLTSFFRDRDCVTLVRPTGDEDSLQRMNQLSYEALRPEFRDQVEGLRSKIFAALKPKMLHGRALNGQMLVALMRAYVDAINRGDIPTISSAWDYVVEVECEGAVAAARALYKEQMDEGCREKLPTEVAQLYSLHVQAKQAALKEFQSHAIGTGLERYRGKLRDGIAEDYDAWLSLNDSMSLSTCTELLKQLAAVVEAKARDSVYAKFEEFDADRLVLRAQYLDRARGPRKHHVYAEYMEAKMSETAIKLRIKREIEWENERTRLREAAETADRKVATHMIEFQQVTSLLKDEKEEVERRLAELRGREQAAREQLLVLRDVQQNSGEQLRAVYAKFEQDKKDLQVKLDAVNEKLLDAERRMMEVRLQHEREKQELREQMQKAVEEARDPNRRLMKKASSARNVDSRSAEAVQMQLESAQAKMIELESQVSSKQRRAESAESAEQQRIKNLEKQIEHVGRLKAKQAEEKAALVVEWQAKYRALEELRELERKESRADREYAVNSAKSSFEELKQELRGQLAAVTEKLRESEEKRIAFMRESEDTVERLQRELEAAKQYGKQKDEQVRQMEEELRRVAQRGCCKVM